MACVYCEEFSSVGKSADDSNSLFYIRNRIVWEHKGFVIFVGLGAMIPGYLLISPKEHITSMSYLSQEKINTLEDILLTVREVVTERFGRPVFIEHGLRHRTHLSTCIEHAHIHCFPIDEDNSLMSEILKMPSIVRISSIGEIAGVTEKYMSYLFFESVDGERFVADATGLESQFSRKCVANSLGIPDKWDWGAFWGIDNIINTIELVSQDIFDSVLHHIQRQRDT